MFAYPDRTLGGTLSAGAWQENLSLDNLKDPLVSAVARSTDALAASTQFKIDYGVARDIRFAAIIGHNAGTAATCRFRWYSDAAYTQLVKDSGTLPFYPPYYPDGTYLSAEDAEVYHPDLTYIAAAQFSARYCLVEIVDTANTAGYFQLGRCITAPCWSPGAGFSRGDTLGFATGTTVSRSLGGVDYFDEQPKRKVSTVKFDHLTLAEGMTHAWEMDRRLDVSGEVYFIYDSDDTFLLYRQRSMLCRMRELTPLEDPYLNGTAKSYNLEEII